MKSICKFLFLSFTVSFVMMSTPLTAQNTSDACSTCKTFCKHFSKPLSFSALSTAMNDLEEYCDGVQNPTPSDTSLCQKHASLKVSFITNFCVKNPSMGKLCGAKCVDECASPVQ